MKPIVAPSYSPPEQYTGGPANPRWDVYALGAVLYHALTGSAPPESPSRVSSPLELDPPLDADIAAVTLKALQLEPEDRFQGIDALRDALALARSPTSVTRTRPLPVPTVLTPPAFPGKPLAPPLHAEEPKDVEQRPIEQVLREQMSRGFTFKPPAQKAGRAASFRLPRAMLIATLIFILLTVLFVCVICSLTLSR